MTTKTIEETYVKFEQHQHVLEKPDMYVGSTENEQSKMWICDSKHPQQFVNREIEFAPGLYKIFDEILVNARDHHVRCQNDKKMEKCTFIKCKIDLETGQIVVENNGTGIPIVIHKEHDVYIPTMLFSSLLTSTNYDKTEERDVGGTNGLGAKLTNIFSQYFCIETLDAKRELEFKHEFRNNMYDTDGPIITSTRKKKPYTRITFTPDYPKFGIQKMTPHIASLFQKRVYDIAATTNISVYLNGERIAVNNFADYIKMYTRKPEYDIQVDATQPNWRVGIVFDADNNLDLQHISFVNGICTYIGGTHVEHVAAQIVKGITAAIFKRDKTITVKPAMVREQLVFFVDATINNVKFDSQTKDKFNIPATRYKCKYVLPDSFLKRIIKMGVVDSVIARVKSREQEKITKTPSSNRAPQYKKLYDAANANKRRGDCALFLTEGDSAKTFALSGMNEINCDYYGVFPLKGKLLNVRNCTLKASLGNEEIAALFEIIGLKHGEKYTSTVGLRYGRIVILTDQDVDGYHIKGLLINFIHHYWPELANISTFIQCLATPLLKVTSTGKQKQCISFNSAEEFDKWQVTQDMKKWNVKYYKGLGTSTPAEARECFKDLETKIISYVCDDDTQDHISLAFSKSRADDRKAWMQTYNRDDYIDSTRRNVPIPEFINIELKSFSIADTERSVPSIMDGQKTCQRKVLFGSFAENIYKNEVKVAILASQVSKVSHYHHGDASLYGAIINMAQNYVGSNNINLLVPCGQFGSRVSGGKDAASPRYIFTQLNGLCKTLFKTQDNGILTYQTDDNVLVEPNFYLPVIPVILVNGTQGIGTGFSSDIYPCNPMEIIKNQRRIINGKKMRDMHPWFRNFRGQIVQISPQKYKSVAKYQIDGDTLTIDDLPYGMWTETYKGYLMGLTNQTPVAKKQDKKPTKLLRAAKKNLIGADIKSFHVQPSDVLVRIVVQFLPGKLAAYSAEELETKMKLATGICLSNMNLFDENNIIAKYDSYQDIMRKFTRVRLEMYEKRKAYLLAEWGAELVSLRWRYKFVKYVMAKKIRVFQVPKAEIRQQLADLKFPKQDSDTVTGYNYLTNLPIISFSSEELQRLKTLIDNTSANIDDLTQKTPQDMWNIELDEFEQEYTKWSDDQDAKYQASLLQTNRKNGQATMRKPRRVVKKN